MHREFAPAKFCAVGLQPQMQDNPRSAGISTGKSAWHNASRLEQETSHGRFSILIKTSVSLTRSAGVRKAAPRQRSAAASEQPFGPLRNIDKSA
jgi:hypothetical protein